MEFYKVFRCPNLMDEKTYLLCAYREWADDVKCPVDFFDELKVESTEFYLEDVACTAAHVSADYVGSIGYDRTEEYTTTKKKYLTEGQSYTLGGISFTAYKSGDYDVDVVEKRTVTDWSPFSTHESYNDVFIDTNSKWKYENLLSIIYLDNRDYTQSDETVAIRENFPNDAMKYFQGAGIRHHADRMNWPGDHQKDIRGHGSAEIFDYSCYFVPCFKVVYSYKGNQYQSYGTVLAQISGIRERHEMPESTGGLQSEKDCEDAFRAVDEKNDKKCDILRFFGGAGMVIGAILFVVGIINLSVGFLKFVGIPLFIIGLGLFITSIILRKVWFKKYRKLYSDYAAHIRDIKQISVKKFLLAKGYTEKDLQGTKYEFTDVNAPIAELPNLKSAKANPSKVAAPNTPANIQSAAPLAETADSFELEEKKIALLKKYKSLMDEGVISQAEFNQKKADVMAMKASPAVAVNNTANTNRLIISWIFKISLVFLSVAVLALSLIGLLFAILDDFCVTCIILSGVDILLVIPTFIFALKNKYIVSLITSPIMLACSVVGCVLAFNRYCELPGIMFAVVILLSLLIIVWQIVQKILDKKH